MFTSFVPSTLQTIYPKLPCPYQRRNSTFGWSATSSNIQQTTSPWWFCLTLQWHGYGKKAHPAPGCLFGRGRARAVFKCVIYVWRPAKIQINFELTAYFSIHCIYCPQNDGITLPPQSAPLTPPIHSLLCHFHMFLVHCCVYNFRSAAI